MSDLNLFDALSTQALDYVGASSGFGAAGRTSGTMPASFLTLKGQPGFYYNAASKILVVTKDGANLANLDFRGVSVYVQANDVTIANSLFDASTGIVGVRGMAGYDNLTVDHCSFDGLKLDKTYTPICAMGTNTTIANSRFTDSQSDVIGIAGGRIAGNVISGSGYQTGAHADAIAFSGFKTNGPITIEGNFIDWRSSPDAKVETNQAIRITSDAGPAFDITIDKNVLLGGSYTIGIHDVFAGAGSITGVKIRDNVIDQGQYGSLFPSRPADLVYQGNVHLSGPAPVAGNESVGASVAMLTAGLSAINGTAANDTLIGKASAAFIAGGAGQDWISAGAGNDVIESGAGRDYLTGGAGSDIFVYRAFDAGRGDLINDFTHGQDRIDLAELPGAPSFASGWTWLGAEAFTGDAWQLRASVKDGVTLVELDRDGDMNADLSIEVTGNHTFSTADFILATKSDTTPPLPSVPSTPGETPPSDEAPVGETRSSGGTVPPTTDPPLPSEPQPPIVEAPPEYKFVYPTKTLRTPTDGGKIVGKEGSELIIGSGHNDVLYGKGGDDVIVGGVGKDRLYGGDGHDRFVFNTLNSSTSANNGRDAIRDFTHSNDSIDLRKIDAITGTTKNDAFTFLDSGRFTGHAGELRFAATKVGGHFEGHIQGDINGDRIIDFSIDIVSNKILTDVDFLL